MASTKDPNLLARFINRVVKDHDTFKTRRAIAQKLGMTESAFSRAVQDEGTLTVEQCCRLARALGMDPASILRQADKRELADLLYGGWRAAAPDIIFPNEMELVKIWRQTPAQEQRAWLNTLLMLHARPVPSGSEDPAVTDVRRRVQADAAAGARVAKVLARKKK